ncbi:MAG TPA: 4'-phosphopantetheinyl transferase superfamily protein [Steroidobacteraceae bacterium]|nr:4'-phosphopantetheinyl transferase superfamily protein [Steroidobacteraceae bacterium]
MGPASQAQFSEPLSRLFPAGAIAAELSGDALGAAAGGVTLAAQSLLTEGEWRSIEHCSELRIRAFVAGRLCAKRALQRLGIEGFSLLPAPDRQPCWPAGVTGSITHTGGYAAAVVGHSAEVGSLGLDSERVADLEERLWPQICAAAELGALQAMPIEQRARVAALCFAAKEAFYKAQFALSGEPLTFQAVRIEWPAMGAGNSDGGMFAIQPLQPLRIQQRAGHAASRPGWTGRYRFHADYVSAGIALEARTARIE